jgi:hypothetical protein
LAERARVVHRATTRMADAVAKIYQTPGVDALFKGMFGYAWVDLELILAPRLADIRSAAEGKARVFLEERTRRRHALATHTANLTKILREAGLPIPPDVRD